VAAFEARHATVPSVQTNDVQLEAVPAQPQGLLAHELLLP
jgi:hypothetical protein